LKKYFSIFNLTNPFFENPKFFLFYFLSRGISFFKEVVISYYFGATSYKDAYVLILSFYETFISIIKNIIETTFSPLYFNSKRKRTFIGNYFILITTIVMFLFFLLLNFSNNFFHYLYHSSNNLYNQTIFTIVLLSSVLNIYFVLYKVICNVKGNFHDPEKRNIYFSTLFIVAIIFFKMNHFARLELNDLYILTFSTFISSLGMLLFLLFRAFKASATSRFILYTKKDRFSNLIRQLFKFSIIIVFIHSGQELFQNYLASKMSVGTISWNDYGKKIYSHGIGLSYLFMGPVVINFIQNFSQNVKFDLLLNIKKYLPLYLLISAFGFFLSPEIVRILFFRGAFSFNDWINVTAILRVFFISLPFGIYTNFAYFIFSTISFKLSLLFNLIIFFTFIFTCLLLNSTFTYNTFALATLVSNLFGFSFYLYYILGPYKKIFNRNL
jgi:putative peptidoglycan lipid II flippase